MCNILRKQEAPVSNSFKNYQGLVLFFIIYVINHLIIVEVKLNQVLYNIRSLLPDFLLRFFLLFLSFARNYFCLEPNLVNGMTEFLNSRFQFIGILNGIAYTKMDLPGSPIPKFIQSEPFMKIPLK